MADCFGAVAALKGMALEGDEYVEKQAIAHCWTIDATAITTDVKFGTVYAGVNWGRGNSCFCGLAFLLAPTTR